MDSGEEMKVNESELRLSERIVENVTTPTRKN
jgi:hypothetical protein